MLKSIASPLFVALVLLALVALICIPRWAVRQRFQRVARRLLLAGFAILLLASLPVVANAFSFQLGHSYELPRDADLSDVQAVAVLGGGAIRRLPCGVRAYRRAGAHLLVLTGVRSEMEGRDFSAWAVGLGVPREEVLTVYSTNTASDAEALRKMPQLRAGDNVAIATDAWHLPRAMREVRRYFPRAKGVGCGGGGRPGFGLQNFVPTVGGLMSTTSRLHEYLGIAWFQLRSALS